MTKKGLFGGSLFLLLVVMLSSSATAQNVRIGTVDQGAAYAVPAGTTAQSMMFTEDGATATAENDARWSGRIFMNASGTLHTASTTATLIVDGGIEGCGDLTKTGSGTLLLNSASTQTGWTTIDGGTFQAGKNLVFSAASPFSLVSGSLDLNGTTQEIASLSGSGTLYFGTGQLTVGNDESDTTFMGDFGDSGTLVKTGSGTMVLTGTGSFFDAVDFDVAAGTLNINGTFNGPGGATTVRNGATLGGSGTLFDVNVESGGTLAPGTRLGYAVLATDTLTIDNDLTLNTGSLLSIRVDDAGNSDQVIVSGIFTNINGNAGLEIDALAGNYAATETYEAFLVDAFGTDLADFKIGNISLRQQFLELRDVTENPNTFCINRIENYFTAPARGENQLAVARAFDRTSSAGLWRAMTNIAASTNQAAVDAAYREISGAVNANSLMLGQWRTSTYALKHLDLTHCGMSQNYAFWLEAVHQTTDFDADFNSRAYGISRTGFLLGAEERRDDCVFGMLGGYSQPRLYSRGDQFKADDAQFGFYAGTKVCGFLETKIHIGYGHQEYDSRRFIRSPLLIGNGDADRINAEFSGDSMSMTLEFAVPYDWVIFQIKPLFAIDSDLTWQYGYAEVGDTGYELQFRRNFFDRTFTRIGVSGQIGSVKTYTPIALTGRLHYAHQVGGHSAPVAHGVFLADPSTSLSIYGVNPGRDFVNVGVGFRWNIDSDRCFYGDYDFHGSKRSNGHFASLGYMQKW